MKGRKRNGMKSLCNLKWKTWLLNFWCGDGLIRYMRMGRWVGSRNYGIQAYTICWTWFERQWHPASKNVNRLFRSHEDIGLTVPLNSSMFHLGPGNTADIVFKRKKGILEMLHQSLWPCSCIIFDQWVTNVTMSANFRFVCMYIETTVSRNTAKCDSHVRYWPVASSKANVQNNFTHHAWMNHSKTVGKHW